MLLSNLSPGKSVSILYRPLITSYTHHHNKTDSTEIARIFIQHNTLQMEEVNSRSEFDTKDQVRKI